MSGGGKSGSVYAGTKYYLGAHMVLCLGNIDSLNKIYADDKLLWSGVNTGGLSYIDKPNVWGGESKQGGVVGNINLLRGEASQPVDPYLNSKISGNIPAFRGVASVVLQRLYYGMNPYVKGFSFEVKRTGNLVSGLPQWQPQLADINGDMNPSHILRECITSRVFGMGKPESYINESMFLASATTLHDEGFGLSFTWSSESTVESFMEEVLEHIGGALVEDSTSGSVGLSLFRKDYIEADLPVFSEDNISKFESFDRAGISETVNTLVVTYSSIKGYSGESVTVSDPANIHAQGGIVSQKKSYIGITKPELALKVAQRDLLSMSRSLSKCRFKVSRVGFDLVQGSLIKLSWSAIGLTETVFRVTQVQSGLFLKGDITVSAVEDIFSFTGETFTSVQPSGWVEPSYEPVDTPYKKAVEASYVWVTYNISSADIATLQSDFSIAVSIVSAPSSGHQNYYLNSKLPTTSFVEKGLSSFCSRARLSVTGMVRETTSSVVYYEDFGVFEDESLVGSYAYIGEELLVVLSINKSTKTIVFNRGIYDTTPQPHAVGSTILFCEGFEVSDGNEYSEGEVINMRARTQTSLGILELASASEYSITTSGRYHKPYCGGNFKINGVSFPSSVLTSGGETITWSHRDRELQTVYPNLQSEGDIGPESGVTYTVKVFDRNGTLIHTQSNISGTSYVFPSATELTATGETLVEPTITYQLSAQRSGYDSHQNQTCTVTRP